MKITYKRSCVKDRLWRSFIKNVHEDRLWKSFVRIAYEDRLWRSLMKIVYEDRSWRSFMKIIYEGRLWRSFVGLWRSFMKIVCEERLRKASDVAGKATVIGDEEEKKTGTAASSPNGLNENHDWKYESATSKKRILCEIEKEKMTGTKSSENVDT